MMIAQDNQQLIVNSLRYKYKSNTYIQSKKFKKDLHKYFSFFKSSPFSITKFNYISFDPSHGISTFTQHSGNNINILNVIKEYQRHLTINELCTTSEIK
jgi:hypothetical protein